MKNFVEPLERLINELTKLGGVGKKTAERYAYSIINGNAEWVHNLSEAIADAKDKIHTCAICGDFTDKEICDACAHGANEPIICVVTEPKDINALDRVRDFKGAYHVLHGVISPLDNKGPDDLNLKSLLMRIQKDHIQEVIIATNPDVEGEATAMYIANLLKPLGVKVTRLATGISMGSELEYADELTLSRALKNRTEI